jgi:hypothetical protein
VGVPLGLEGLGLEALFHGALNATARHRAGPKGRGMAQILPNQALGGEKRVRFAHDMGRYGERLPTHRAPLPGFLLAPSMAAKAGRSGLLSSTSGVPCVWAVAPIGKDTPQQGQEPASGNLGSFSNRHCVLQSAGRSSLQLAYRISASGHKRTSGIGQATP